MVYDILCVLGSLSCMIYDISFMMHACFRPCCYLCVYHSPCKEESGIAGKIQGKVEGKRQRRLTWLVGEKGGWQEEDSSILKEKERWQG